MDIATAKSAGFKYGLKMVGVVILCDVWLPF